MAQLKAAVIGLGMGRHHIAGYQKHPEVEVVAVADPDASRLEEIAAAYGVNGRYTDPEDMLTQVKPDIVSIAVPNKYHAELSIMALEAGAHVLCEKPMAMNAGEARQMMNAAEHASRRLMINFSYRFTPVSQALKAQVDGGLLGTVYFGRTSWHRRKGMPRFGGWFGKKDLAGGGPLIDLGVHRIDLAMWLMGYPEPVWVSGSTYNHLGSQRAAKEGKNFTVEDLAVGMVKLADGSTLEVEASWAAHIQERELMETRLLGTEGGLVQRNVGGGYDFEACAYFERNGAYHDVVLTPAQGEPQTAYEHFAECILTDVPHTATAEEGYTIMRILDGIYESAASGKPVELS